MNTGSTLGHAKRTIDRRKARMASKAETRKAKVSVQHVLILIGPFRKPALLFLAANRVGAQQLCVDEMIRAKHHQRRTNPERIARVVRLVDATLETDLLTINKPFDQSFATRQLIEHSHQVQRCNAAVC